MRQPDKAILAAAVIALAITGAVIVRDWLLKPEPVPEGDLPYLPQTFTCEELKSEIRQRFATGKAGGITAADLRRVLLDLVESIEEQSCKGGSR